MKKQPILVVLIYFILGIIFQDRWVWDERIVLIGLVISLLVQLIFLWKQSWVYRWRGFVVGVFFFFIGVFVHSIHPRKPDFSFDENRFYKVIFKLDKVFKTNQKYRKYKVKAFWRGESFDVLLNIPKERPRLDFNHYYQSRLKIYQVKGNLNDYSFDYQKYLARKGIFYQSFIFSEIKVAKAKTFYLSDFIEQKRNEAIDQIEQSSLSETTQMLMKSILLADKTEFDVHILNEFRRSGVVHILAISGMHIAIIFGFFYLLFSFLLKTKKYAIAWSLFAIWGFGIFIGLGNSVFRACLMLTIYYAFYFRQVKRDFLHTWSLAMLVILAIDTQQLFDIGFQLSFSAVFGIFWLYRPLDRFFKRILPKIPFVAETLSVTLSAQLFTLPIVLYYFHSFSLIGILANLLLVPLMQILVIFSFIVLIILILPFDGEMVIRGYDFSVQFVLKAIRFFSDFDWSYIENIPFHYLELGAVFVILFLLRAILERFSVRKMIHLSYGILLLGLIRLGLNYYYQSIDEMKVHFHYHNKIISVKKGQKITFYSQTDNNHKAIKRYIIVPYLLQMRGRDFEFKLVSNNCKSVIFNNEKIDF